MSALALRHRQGSYTVVGLAVMSFLAIPLLAMLWVTSDIVVESNRAQGMSYAIAYSAVNRGADTKFFTGTGTLQLYAPTDYPPSSDYTDEVNEFSAALNQAYRATRVVAAPSAPDASAGHCGARLCYQLVPQPTFGTTGPTFFPVRVHNIVPEPIGNASSKICTNFNSADRQSPASDCWVDGQARIDGSNYFPRSSGHFTTGVDVETGFTLNFFIFPAWLPGGNFSSTRSGVAIVGRPCQDPGDNCAH